MNCIFCDIINKKAEAEIIYENEDIISFLDIRPMNFGHALVIPKTHFENFLSVPKPLLNKLIESTQYISEVINNSLNTDGFNIVVNNGSAAGQSVFHFHFHIIPRFKSDSFNFKPIFKKYENEGFREYADKIRIAVNK